MTIILITGSKGFIGRHLSKALSEKGYTVYGYDSADDEAENILSPKTLRGHVECCAAVIHLAGVSRVEAVDADLDLAYWTNVTGTEIVAKAADAANVPIIYASSTAVYGNAHEQPVPETMHYQPLSNYGLHAKSAERIVTQAKRHAVLRLPNVYGGFDDHPSRVVPAVMRAARDGETAVIYGKEVRCDFLHIDDAVAAFGQTLKFLDRYRTLGPTNITTGIGTSLYHLVSKCGRAYKTEISTQWHDRNEKYPKHFSGIHGQAQRTLNWTPTIRLQDGLRRMRDSDVQPKTK